MNLLITLIVYAIYDLVQIIIYIRLPTTDAYGTRDIFILSVSLLGPILEDNLQLIVNWVEISLQFCMLKRHKIFDK